MNSEWWKSTTAWAAAGGTIGAVAVVLLNANQISGADHYATIIGTVAAGVAALAAAFKAVVTKKNG